MYSYPVNRKETGEYMDDKEVRKQVILDLDNMDSLITGYKQLSARGWKLFPFDEFVDTLKQQVKQEEEYQEWRRNGKK